MPTQIKPRHPGVILSEVFLKPCDLSENRLALELRVPVTRISAIARGERAISPDTALRLARYFRTSPGFWMDLQARHDLYLAEQRNGPQIAQDVRPIELTEQALAALRAAL